MRILYLLQHDYPYRLILQLPVTKIQESRFLQIDLHRVPQEFDTQIYFALKNPNL